MGAAAAWSVDGRVSWHSCISKGLVALSEWVTKSAFSHPMRWLTVSKRNIADGDTCCFGQNVMVELQGGDH